MRDAVLSGLVTGWAIAVPIGAVGAFLVTLAAHSSWRVGAAAALGIAAVDGVYAAVAVLGGAAVAALLAPVTAPLALASGVVLLVVAVLTAWHSLTIDGAPRAIAAIGPARAFALFFGVTAVNPTTVVYFVAIVLGNQRLVDGPVEAAAFVTAAFVASASWQLALAAGGATLGRVATGPRGRVATGLVSAVVIAGLAIHTMLR